MDQDYLISIITPTYNTPDEFAAAAEEELRRLVPAYGQASIDGYVRPLAVCMLQPETQLAYRDKRMYVQKTAPDQIKPVHVLTDNPAAERFFRTFAEKVQKQR